jgi:hypothetical protein
MWIRRSSRAALASGLAAFWITALGAAAPAGAQDAGGYGVACADRAYFAQETRESPVEQYVRIDAPAAARAFLTRTTGGAPADQVDAVIVLHMPGQGDRVGVVPFADGCALDTGFLGPKMAIDQVLAGMLHDGLID